MSNLEPTHQHVKSGSQYFLIGYGKMQTTRWLTETSYSDRGTPVECDTRSANKRAVAICRSVDDGSLWVCPKEEFEGTFDSLFVALSEISK